MGIIGFIAGVIFGAVIVLVINWLRGKEAKKIAKELIAEAETQKLQDIEIIINRIKDSFGALSLEALSKSSDEFLKLAAETLSKQTELGEKDLTEKKLLIDQSLQVMKADLEKVQELMTGLEKDREQKFGELTNQLKSTAEQTARLSETTGQLHQALANVRVRGQWGERMAEDVLRLAGFIEGVNYLKQRAIDSLRPDFTFLLPQGLKVNMDVKFPFENYILYLEANETEKGRYKSQFLRDVKSRVKEVTTKDYINPEDNTLDYVLVFIPNEQVYGFIQESDRSILDDSMKNKVVLCSPLTLYAILGVIRQAVDNFSLERSTAQILSLFGTFYKNYSAFMASLDKMGRKIDEAQNEFISLTSERRKKLFAPLQKIEDLRIEKGILPSASLEEV
ncbi:MAG: DNA recombination protein RmuC [bacterium]|nr:DNA recombination protein RmuC [bacterium]